MTSSPTQNPTTAPTLSVVYLYTEPFVLVIDHSWTVEELLARSELEQSRVWADGEELTFFYQSDADAVHICCGIQLPMQRVGDSDLWALTVRIEDLAEAVISYSFIPDWDRDLIEAEEGVSDEQVWRGPEAPPAPERAEALEGRVDRYTIDSVALGGSRDLTVYLPPDYDPIEDYPVVYSADGQSVDDFATVLDPQIVDGSVPAVIVVGVHSAEYEGTTEVYDPAQDLRAQEYLLGNNPERFEAHERFFVYEVSDWAEQTLSASSRREECAVFGFSNGGAFAVTMGIRHPEQHGVVLAFSLGAGPEGLGTPEWTADTAPRQYLVAGTLEPFGFTTERWVARLNRMGVEHVYRERVCGHDVVMWVEEFPSAIAWAFQDR
jgi:enterochelin esterase-like enzyme